MKTKQNISRFGILIMFMVITLTVKSQQEPMFSQYMFNTLSVNPAYAGTRNSLNLTSLSRLQWIGLEDAPKTFSVSMHTPFNKKKVGVGFSVVDDEVGPVRNTYIAANYAYRLTITENITLSMGIKGGISNYHVGLTDLELNNPEDPLFQADEKKLDPNVGLGFYLYSNQFYVGFSAPKLLETTFDKEISEEAKMQRHYYFIGGYVMSINSKWDFKPSILMKMVQGAPLSNDISLQFFYNQRIWLGAMYRIGDAAGVFVDYKVNNQLTIGYGYDFTLNGLSGMNKGTHEILLSYDFDNLFSTKVKSPRYF